MPLWPRWEQRTGSAAYGAKHRQFYDHLKTRGTTVWRPGCTAAGLFDATEDLWWRDCKYVAQRDALGPKVFWSRGNGWVLAAMARMLMVLPASDPDVAEYRSMLQRMSARVAELQGADGMWRTSLLSPSLYPAPETSGTALFTYAMAYGIRTGVLDAATYLPVVLDAWQGLTTTSLKSSGFLSHCQGVGEAPSAPSTTTSIAYCVGAFGLAASEVAKLDGFLAADPFSRTVTGGLGTADVGGAWTTAGPAADLAVAGGVGTLRTPAGQARAASLGEVSARGTDVRATVGFRRPTSGSVYTAVLARRVGTASYAGRAVVAADGSVRAQVQRSGTTVRSVDVPGLTFVTTDRLNLRVQATGASPTTVRVRVWKPGTTEPTAWHVSVSDSTAGLQVAGGVGVWAYLSSGASPSSVVVSVDGVTARRTG
jgi:Glycosyl Hydrolase Family 88